MLCSASLAECNLACHGDEEFAGICRDNLKTFEGRNGITSLTVQVLNTCSAGIERDISARIWSLAFRLPSCEQKSVFGDQLRDRAREKNLNGRGSPRGACLKLSVRYTN